MFLIKGFRASLDFASGKKNQHSFGYTATSAVSVSGQYRTNREEFFGYGNTTEPHKKLLPSMVKLPPSIQPAEAPIRPTKSTADLTLEKNVPQHLRKSSPNVSMDPRGSSDYQNTSDSSGKNRKKAVQEKPKKPERKNKVKTDSQREEQKRLQKEQKLQKKLASDERAKLKKEAANSKKVKKGKAPQPLPSETLPVPVRRAKVNQVTNTNSTNTLESSISRSSGPPPYSETELNVMPNSSDGTGNTSFGKKIEEVSSWDLVSQHREQIRRPVAPTRRTKVTVMDLKYEVAGPSGSMEHKSEA